MPDGAFNQADLPVSTDRWRDFARTLSPSSSPDGAHDFRLRALMRGVV
jgi:hypothetical protein